MENNVQDKEPRIGAFICKCGTEVGEYIDTSGLVQYANTIPGVIKATEIDFACLAEGIKIIQNSINKDKLERVVVAACSPKTHGSIFMKACEDAGLNKYLIYIVNLREQCSWVHLMEKENATQKAKDLLRMGIARAVYLEPQEEVRVDVEPVALIIGGGISGMTAAINIANQGFETHLIEKEAELGGFVRNIHTLYQNGKDANEAIMPLIEQVKSNDKIHLHLESELKDLEGFVGNYDATIANVSGDEKKVQVGTIIVATGAEEYKPVDLYGYGEFDNVITMTDFEKMSKEGTIPENLKNIAFIQCVGSRGQDKVYCSRICCTISIKNAMKLMEMSSSTEGALETPTGAEMSGEPEPTSPAETESSKKVAGTEERQKRRRERRERRRPGRERISVEEGRQDTPGVEITIFNRGITTYGVEHELLYNQARERRIKFTRFVPENPPKVRLEDGKLCIEYFHETLKSERKIYPDLIVLATPLIQRPNVVELSRILKVPLGEDNFFQEAHVKLRPVDFATDGIFSCGTCHAPADITESVTQALGAASRATNPLKRGYIQAEAITSSVTTDLCCACKTCEGICPYGAIQVKSTDAGNKAEVLEAVCKGCGACASVCPEGAITIRNYTNEQLISEGIAALREAIL